MPILQPRPIVNVSKFVKKTALPGLVKGKSTLAIRPKVSVVGGQIEKASIPTPTPTAPKRKTTIDYTILRRDKNKRLKVTKRASTLDGGIGLTTNPLKEALNGVSHGGVTKDRTLLPEVEGPPPPPSIIDDVAPDSMEVVAFDAPVGTTDPRSMVRIQLDTVTEAMRLNLEDASKPAPPVFDVHPDVMRQIVMYYEVRWPVIMTYIQFARLRSSYNIRLGDGACDLRSIRDFLFNQLYARQKYVFRINVSPGMFIYCPDLKQPGSEYGTVNYYYPSWKNFEYFDKPFTITDYSSFVKFVDALQSIDLLNFCKNARPSTKWQLLFCSQLQFDVTKIYPWPLGGVTSGPVGCGLHLPVILKRPCIVALTHRPQPNGALTPTCPMYKDHLCLFRCLVLCYKVDRLPLVSLDAHAHFYFTLYYKNSVSVTEYKGFPLEDLHHFERVFKVNVNVFTLKATVDPITGTPVNICEILRESTSVHTRTMNCNLYQNHFSFIKSLALYCRRYICEKCGKLFKTHQEHKEHKRTACDIVRNVYPGGPYIPTPSIFDLIESCGVSIPDCVPRFFPHYIIYDLESFLSKCNLPDDSTCVNFENRHVLCSGGVVANFKPFTEGRVFIVDNKTTSEQVARDILQYMLDISDESYRCGYSVLTITTYDSDHSLVTTF